MSCDILPTMASESGPIVVEQVYSASIDQLWDAITRPEQMRQWYFEVDDFQATVGFEAEFSVETGGREFPHVWKVTDVVARKSITYNWTYRGYPGDSDVTFELFEQGGRARLRLIHKGMESFPQDIPEFTRQSCVAGWKYFVRERLKGFLEFFDQRQSQADMQAFDRIMSREGGEPPQEGDELP